jgi:hypothetical protein
MHEVTTVGNVTAARRFASRLTPGGVISVSHGPMLVAAHGERSGEKRVHLSRDLHVLCERECCCGYSTTAYNDRRGSAVQAAYRRK